MANTGKGTARALAAAALLAATALAAAEGPERPLAPEEFEARSVGRTFYYNADGLPFGVEQYLPGRKVIWAFTGDDCRKGEWYAEGGLVCFVYEDEPDPQCWTFYDSPRGLIARFEGDPTARPLVMVEDSPEPMACLGPNLGV